MRKLFLTIMLLTGLLVCRGSSAWQGLWESSIIYSDNTSITFAWDASISPCTPGKFCGYEMELRHLEIPTYIDAYKIVNLSTTQKQVNYKKSGHYKMFMRSMSCDDSNLTLNCVHSVWIDSINQGMIVIGLPSPAARPWILYWRIPAPSGGGIE